MFLLWEHGEESLKDFLTTLNSCHSTIKFTAEYSLEEVNFLDVKVIRKGDQIVTDLYVKPTDTHQYLQASSCHVYHSKISIPYSQTLRLNRICSEPEFFDKRCDELENWLQKRGYNPNKVRQQVLKARKFSRDSLLNKEKSPKDEKLTFNITYHPAYARIKNVLNNIHLLLTPDEEHRKVFSSVPIVGFKNGKSLKNWLVRAKLPVLDSQNVSSGGCKKCGRKNCKICMYISETETFKSSFNGKTHKIKEKLDCNSEMVVYLIECKCCKKQYVGSTNSFRKRFNNYKSAQKRFQNGKHVFQNSFHSHFSTSDHSGSEDWSFTIIEKCPNISTLREREMFWQLQLDSFQPNGLNEKEVDISIGVT